MSQRALIIASILSAIVVIGLAGLSFWQVKKDYVQTKAGLEAAQRSADHNLAQAEALKNELAAQKELIEALQKEKEAATQAQKDIESQMRSALESRDITISELQGKLTVNILDRILFDSGEAQLKPEGEQVLAKIGSVLAQYPSRQIHVIGHTDNIPIRASAHDRYPSNWELSTARANAAVRYLSEKGGVDPKRLGAVGYGEFRPVADNATAEGRAANRRIAIVVLSEELVGSDITRHTNTNLPPITPPPLNAAHNATNADPAQAEATNAPVVSDVATNTPSTNTAPPIILTNKVVKRLVSQGETGTVSANNPK